MTMTSPDTAIDHFIACSLLLNGREVTERPQWNTCATADAIRHFAWGTSDSNPLWLDPAYARATPHGGLIAPPAFLCSVLYPFLHGAPVDVPLTSLIGKLEMEWQQPIREGDRLRASVRQLGVTDTLDRAGRRLVLIDAETRYWNQRDELVGRALGTMARVARGEADRLSERKIHHYDAAEQSALRDALSADLRTGGRIRAGDATWVGQPLPTFVRGPLTIGDLICWQAAIGPSYRGGALGYRDLLQAPHNAAVNPVTGWPVKQSQQHEDFLLAAQRGMPAPFDNSLMRFAWLTPMLTDWIGDHGFLSRLRMETGAPILYGDTTWYRGIVTGKRPAADGRDRIAVTIKITGINQLGETTTSGEAEVVLPVRCVGPDCQAYPAADTGQNPAVLDRFAVQAKRRPAAVAVQCGSERISYADLDERVSGLAAALVDKGVRPGDVVALVLERNFDAVVAILATLKLGCAYLPLDPSLPAAAHGTVLAAANPRLILAPDWQYASLRERLPLADAPTRSCGEILAFEDLRKGFPAPRAAPVWPSPAPDSLAYIMPTSGTLGAPRLVAVARRSVGRYLEALCEGFDIKEDDSYLHTAAFTFSASVRQLLLPLSVGARLILAEEQQRFNLLALLQLIDSQQITVWDTVPTLWRACIEHLSVLAAEGRPTPRFERLRLILSTGEALPWDLPCRWRNDLRHATEIVNLYSQTETAGTVSAYRVPVGLSDRQGFVPLGRPLAYATLELRDANLNPVPAGAVGEICVGGCRLAEGYVGCSGLTAERFLLLPFRHEGYYRTGDLARWRDDGELEFVGRSDQRVKIRGQRVELSAVEDALRSVIGVADAAVRTDVDDRGDTRLLAYLTAADANLPEPTTIRDHLRGILPDAALPARFVTLPNFPRNAAGKLDRAALPLPERDGMSPAASSEAPMREPERTVEQVFAEVLGFRHVGADESFFDLGGNSLTAALVISRLTGAFDVSLPIARFYERPTVAAVSQGIIELLVQQVDALPDDEVRRLLDDGRSD